MKPEATAPAAKPRRLKWVLLCLLAASLLIGAQNTVSFLVLKYWQKGRIVQAEREAYTILLALNFYQREFGKLPQGDNAAIVAALQAEIPNRKMTVSFPAESISAKGEFMDPWGSPYHIDVSDPANPKVYSFGPNKRDEGGAGDDVVSWR